MFASLVLESILTLVVVDKAGLGAGVVDQVNNLLLCIIKLKLIAEND